MKTCCCGHTDEEHRKGKMGLHECEIDSCDCICFDWDGEDEIEPSTSSTWPVVEFDSRPPNGRRKVYFRFRCSEPKKLKAKGPSDQNIFKG